MDESQLPPRFDAMSSIAAGEGCRAMLYDRAMRLPASLYTGFLLIREIRGLGDWSQAQMVPILASPLALAILASRVALILFLILLIALYLTRHPPLARLPGLVPRLVGLVGATLTLAMVLLPRAPESLVLNMASALLILLGNYLAIVAVSALGRSLSIMPEARRLVTTGPYRLVRHPLYVAEEIAILGVFLQFRSWPAAAILAVHLLCQLGRMHYEEQVLRSTFPDYDRYAGRTARLVPGIY